MPKLVVAGVLAVLIAVTQIGAIGLWGRLPSYGERAINAYEWCMEGFPYPPRPATELSTDAKAEANLRAMLAFQRDCSTKLGLSSYSRPLLWPTTLADEQASRLIECTARERGEMSAWGIFPKKTRPVRVVWQWLVPLDLRPQLSDYDCYRWSAIASIRRLDLASGYLLFGTDRRERKTLRLQKKLLVDHWWTKGCP